jgi:hypothetical protein
VIIPVSTHTAMSQNGVMTERAMSAETMNIPDPIIVPATSIVASVNVMAFMNFDSAAAVAALSVPLPERLALSLTHVLRLRVGALHFYVCAAWKIRVNVTPRRGVG